MDKQLTKTFSLLLALCGVICIIVGIYYLASAATLAEEGVASVVQQATKQAQTEFMTIGIVFIIIGLVLIVLAFMNYKSA